MEFSTFIGCTAWEEVQVKTITEKLSCGQSYNDPNQERIPSRKDIRDMKTMRLTTTVTTRPTAEVAPLDAASNTLVSFSLKRHVGHVEGHTPWLLFGTLPPPMSSYTLILMSLSSLHWDVSVSGQKVLAMAREAGAVMTVDVSTWVALAWEERARWLFPSHVLYQKPVLGWRSRSYFKQMNTRLLTPREMYAASMVPETPAKPTVISAWISESVSLLIYGRTRIKHSAWKQKRKRLFKLVNFLMFISVVFIFLFLVTCPRNIVPAETTDSTGVVPMVTCII